MDNKNFRSDKRIYLLFFIASFFLALIAIYPFALKYDGMFILRDDFNKQMLPYAESANRILKNGLASWSFDLDLGSPFLTGYSYYYLFSPFQILYYLFPSGTYAYVAPFLISLKYATASLGALIYVKKYVNANFPAMAAALMYGFCGFQNVNLTFQFNDYVAFFPFLILSLDHAMTYFNSDTGLYEKNSPIKKFTPFILMVAFTAILNYYFLIEEVVFLVIYFIFKYFSKDIRLTIKKILSCIICGISGILISAAIFFPNMYFILQNPRASETDGEGFFWEIERFIFVLKGILLPAEAMYDNSAGCYDAWDSTCCYIPMLGLTLVIAYILKNKRDWLSKLIITCFILSLFRGTNAMFALFTAGYHQRWWFMFVLMMCLAGAYVLNDIRNYPVFKGGLIYNGIIILFLITLFFIFKDAEGNTYVYHPMRLILLSLISISGSVIFMMLHYIFNIRKQNNNTTVSTSLNDEKNNLNDRDNNNPKDEQSKLFASSNAIINKPFKYSFIIILSLYCITGTSYNIYSCQKDSDISRYIDYIKMAKVLDLPDDNYRTLSSENYVNMLGNASGTSSFSSTCANVLYEFDALFDYESGFTHIQKDEIYGLDKLLGAKYLIFEESKENGNIHLYGNEVNVLSDEYMTSIINHLFNLYGPDTDNKPSNDSPGYASNNDKADNNDISSNTKPSPHNITDINDDKFKSILQNNNIQKIETKNRYFYVMEQNASPIGYRVTNYITYDELMSYDKSERGIILNYAVVIDENSDNTNNASDALNHLEINDINTLKENLENIVTENTNNSVSEFTQTNSGFTCKTNYDTESFIYFTIPCEEGWHVYVDGSETDIISSGSMLLINVSKGEHEINAVYKTPLLRASIIISCVSIIVLIGLNILNPKLLKNEKIK